MLKGIAVESIAVTTLTLMVGSLSLAVVLGGGMGDALQEGFESISNSSGGQSVEIKNDDISTAKEKFSALTEYVRDKATDCDNVGEYDGLEGTSLTQTPKCVGGPATIARPADWATDQGNDAEGLYSRVGFEIMDGFELSTKQGVVKLTDTSSSFTLTAVRKGGYKERTSSGEATEGNFVAFLDFENPKNRANDFLYQHPLWSEDGDSTYRNSASDHPPTNSWKKIYKNGVKLQLCEGDKGYIQQNNGHASQTGESGLTFPVGVGERFPHIVITERGKKCGSVPDVPEGNNIVGDTVYFEIDAGKTDNWGEYVVRGPESQPFVDIWDKGQDYTLPGGKKIEHLSNNRCQVGLRDNDFGPAGNDEVGHVSYSPGVYINRNDGLLKNNNQPQNTDLPSISNEMDSGDVFRHLHSNLGFGVEVNENSGIHHNSYSPYIKNAGNFGTAKYNGEMTLQGDLLCVQKRFTDNNYAKWFMCDFRLDKQKRTVTPNVNGKTYECDPRTGEWSEK